MTQTARISGLIAGQQYEVRVRGRSIAAASPWTTATFTVGGDATVPTVPTGLAATGMTRAVSLTWTNPATTDLRYVEIWERSTAVGAVSAKVGESRSNFFVRDGMAPNESRLFKVRSVDNSGNASAFTAEVVGTSAFIVAADIQDAILNTAKFASSIRPIAIPAVAADLAALKQTNQVIFPQVALTDPGTSQALAAQRLYRWSGSAWVSVVSAPEMTGQITADQIAANAVTAGKIAAGAISATEIASGAITSSKIAADAITATNIVAGTITALQIESEGITKTTSSIGSNAYRSVGSYSDILTVNFTASGGAKRVILVSVECSDESAFGVPNSDTQPWQTYLRLKIAGTVQSGEVDSFCSIGTTTAITWSFLDGVSRTGTTDFALQGKAQNFGGATRTVTGFRDPTLTILEFKR